MLKVFVGEWNHNQMRDLLVQPLLYDIVAGLVRAIQLDLLTHIGSLFVTGSNAPVRVIMGVTQEVCAIALAHLDYGVGLYTNNADVLDTLAHHPEVCKFLESITLNREDNTSLTLSGEDFSRAYRVGAVDIRRL